METQQSAITVAPFMWYTVVAGTNPLQQGDFLDDFPVIVPNLGAPKVSKESETTTQEIDGVFRTYNVIVMTQSCDFNDIADDDLVMLCPRYDLTKAKIGNKKFDNADGWGKLRKGHVISAHLINKCDMKNHEFEYQVIDLRRVFTSPYSYVKEVAEKQEHRIRLLPPYREHLAQAFARQFMRVGLPVDLPPEYPYKK